jgi:WD40 repeat protein
LALSPDDQRVAYGTSDGVLALASVPGAQLLAFVPGAGQQEHVEAVAFSPDGTKLAVAYAKGVKLWDVAKVLEHRPKS